MSNSIFNMKLLKYGEAIEVAEYKDTVIHLLAAGDGTEIIRHEIKKGVRWSLLPEEGWTALESVLIMSGVLMWKSLEGDVEMGKGDILSCHPVKEPVLFIAETDVDLIYITSQPVFHHYSHNVKNLMNMAVEIEAKDGYTADHCDRIKTYSVKLGERLKLSVNDLYLLNHAGFFHDVGKIKVPEEILLKPGKLTDEEYDIMKLHTVYGREILEKSNIPFLADVGKIVEQHHERFDGKGYPYGLKGDKIDIRAAIVSVVDSFDAMTTDRIYQKGRSKEEALEEIKRCRGTMYHPDVVDEFIKLHNE